MKVKEKKQENKDFQEDRKYFSKCLKVVLGTSGKWYLVLGCSGATLQDVRMNGGESVTRL